ncbi:hypothetical protein ACFX11_036468 [Malus domestica]
MKEDACATQVICANSEFNVAALNSFVKKVKFVKCGTSYAVVAIIALRVEITGKSTLMNHHFDTGFQEMKIECGKIQTTKGIWIAKCVGIEPCTIALDLEGSDSSERGEVGIVGRVLRVVSYRVSAKWETKTLISNLVLVVLVLHLWHYFHTYTIFPLDGYMTFDNIY